MRMKYLVAIAALAALLGGPAVAQTAAPKPAAATAAADSKAKIIDINSASKEELDALPEIGPARSEAIIKGRPYKRKNDLVKKKIIPADVYAAIRHKIIAKQPKKKKS